MARALYSDSEIYLMDDPLSALDADVRNKVFNQAVLGLLKSKTRIIATHVVDYLEYGSLIVIMEDGRIVD